MTSCILANILAVKSQSLQDISGAARAEGGGPSVGVNKELVSNAVQNCDHTL